MPEVTVTRVGGVWFLDYAGRLEPAPPKELLDAWLARRGMTRGSLRFPTEALRARFIDEFGPLSS